MSKSLKRVKTALLDARIMTKVHEMPDLTRTAGEAAAAAGCDIDQIAKSVIFRGEQSGEALLFLTAGGNQIDVAKASTLAGETMGKAGADLIRAQTGFAIGGVSPVGHINPIRAFMDPRLMEFDEIWAAAGTPRHIIPAKPIDIQRICNAQLSNFTS